MNLQSFVYETLKATAGSIFATFYCFSCEDRNLFKGLLGFSGGLIAGVYINPPASGVDYLADIGNKIGIVKPVYAQAGTLGWDATKEILSIWKVFRDLAYSLFVIIFIFIGFAIMFRIKISPQAVVTIESALPKIIVALLLVTFSYAIVGFLIDIMYVLFVLISRLFLDPQIGIIVTSSGWLTDFMVKLSDLVGGLFNLSITQAYVANGVFLILTSILALIFALISGPLGWVIAFLGILVSFIALLRCVLALIKAWVSVILNLIFAPLILTMGALPGSNTIGNWFKDMLANIVVMPIIYTMLLLCCFFILAGIERMFADLPTAVLSIATGWLVGAPIAMAMMSLSPGNFWQFLSSLFLPIVGLAVLWMAPKASDMVKSFIMGKPFEYGTAIGEAIGPVTAGGQMFAQARYAGLETKKAEADMLQETLGIKDTLERSLYQVMNVRGMIKKP